MTDTVPTSSDHYSGTRGQRYFAWQDAPARAVARLEARKFTPYVRQSDVVVDFGCGGGHILASIPCRRRIGIEVNPHARSQADALGIQTAQGSAELAAASADVVISNHALEHTMAPLVELEGLRRVLKPAGCLLLCVPIDDWRAQKRWQCADPSHHLYTWTPRLLRNLLSEAGFEMTRATVVHRGHPGRLTQRLATSLPDVLFDAVAALTAVLVKRREIFAVARPAQADGRPAPAG
jgi:SAM-dependent methyltransferase